MPKRHKIKDKIDKSRRNLYAKYTILSSECDIDMEQIIGYHKLTSVLRYLMS